MASSAGEANLKTNYPIEEGLTAETQTQTGRKMQLEAEDGTVVRKRLMRGIR